MDDKDLNIDEWLKKAAAQQPAPGDTSQELKQQAWSKMTALLDEEEGGKPQPRLFWSRIKWAAIIIPFVATAAVFAATVWLAPHFYKETPPAGSSSSIKQRGLQEQNRQQAAADSLSTIINTTPPSLPADSIAGIAGKTPAMPENESGSIPPALPLPLTPGRSNVAPGNAGNNKTIGNTNNAAAGNINSITKGNSNTNAGNNVNRPGHGSASATTATPLVNNNMPLQPSLRKEKNLPNNKVNKAAAPRAIDDNEAIAAEQTETTVREKRPVSGSMQPKGVKDAKQATPAPEAAMVVLYPVRPRNVFALQLPSLSDASRGQRIPGSASGGGGLSMGTANSRWNLQAGLLSPLNSALGIRVGILYVYPLGNSFYLQPQVSASYLTGYDKAFTHLSVNSTRQDSANPSGWPRYTIDSTFTPYTFKRAFAGSAGINVGYRKNRMAVSTGLVYSMAMASGKKDSATKRSNMVYDTTGVRTSFSDPVFSEGRLPGKQQLSWNFDVSWYVLPRLQAG
ncbi:MAG TPA: hypothetical protein VGD35_05540, partial [Chitinophaga sp.]